MKHSLELTNYGVNELTIDEYNDIDGGFPLIPLIIAGAVALYSGTKLIWDIAHKRQFKIFGPW